MNDQLLRAAALATARALIARWGDAVPFEEIDKGFQVEGKRLFLMSRAEGVFKPAQMSTGALSIRSTLASRYTDEPLSDRRTYYEYSPKPGRNEWLQTCLRDRLDLIYFLQVKPKPRPEYLIIAPVRVVEDDPSRRHFLVDLIPEAPLYNPALLQPLVAPARLHDSAIVKVRLFQAHFRRAVLSAYKDRRRRSAKGGTGSVPFRSARETPGTDAPRRELGPAGASGPRPRCS